MTPTQGMSRLHVSWRDLRYMFMFSYYVDLLSFLFNEMLLARDAVLELPWLTLAFEDAFVPTLSLQYAFMKWIQNDVFFFIPIPTIMRARFLQSRQTQSGDSCGKIYISRCHCHRSTDAFINAGNIRIWYHCKRNRSGTQTKAIAGSTSDREVTSTEPHPLRVCTISNCLKTLFDFLIRTV